MKTNHIIYSQDVQWLGKLWHEFYCILNMHSTYKYVDLFGGYIEETGTKQEVEDNKQETETEQMTAVTKDTNEEEDEPIAMRTQSHDSEPIASRTRSQQNLTEMAGFVDIKTGTNINEWLNEIAFGTSKMSDPTEPQTFQQASWHPDLTAREKW